MNEYEIETREWLSIEELEEILEIQVSIEEWNPSLTHNKTKEKQYV